MTIGLTRPRSQFRASVWVWAAAALLILAAVLALAAPQAYPGGSTYSKALEGYSQWYAFMKQQGHEVQRWQKPYAKLKGQGQVLIQIADLDAEAKPTLQSQEALDWVERGNTLIQLSWAGQVTGAPFRSELQSPSGLVFIETSRRYRMDVTKLKGGTAALSDASGNVIWSYERGKGHIVMGTYPWMAANAYAHHDGNFRILETLAAQLKGPIWIDEWLHGHRDFEADAETAEQQSPWDYLSRRPIAVVFGQGAVLLLLLLWGKNQRFGALTSVTVPPRNSSEQYIQALAATLNANGKTEYVRFMLDQSFRQRLQSQLGLGSLHADILSDEAIAQQWSSVTGRPAQALLDLLHQPDSRLSEPALMKWVKSCETALQDLVSGSNQLRSTSSKDDYPDR
jgi:Domain of unknown function (DUF4350)